jgi:hypothetical protein
MQKRPKIGIIISTTRPGRFADIPTNWLFNIAKERNDAISRLSICAIILCRSSRKGAPARCAAAERSRTALGEKVASLDG